MASKDRGLFLICCSIWCFSLSPALEEWPCSVTRWQLWQKKNQCGSWNFCLEATQVPSTPIPWARRGRGQACYPQGGRGELLTEKAGNLGNSTIIYCNQSPRYTDEQTEAGRGQGMYSASLVRKRWRQNSPRERGFSGQHSLSGYLGNTLISTSVYVVIKRFYSVLHFVGFSGSARCILKCVYNFLYTCL